MSELTIFSAPKAFQDPHIDNIQRNAVLSWKNLGSDIEVILIGDDLGIQEAAIDLGVRHISKVKVNEWGTPRVDSIFELARETSSAELLLYINADILLLPETVEVIQQVQELKEEFLIVGRRWDLDINTKINFESDWSSEMKIRAKKEGKLQAPTAMDYFIFPKHLYQEIPPFAIGRAGWDNWMVYHGMQQPWSVIDVTPTLMVIHQNHDYSHLPGGRPHFTLDESNQNVDLGGGYTRSFDLLDVKLVFRGGRIKKARLTLHHLLRKAERLIIPQEKRGWRWWITRRIRRLRKRMNGTLKKKDSVSSSISRVNK